MPVDVKVEKNNHVEEQPKPKVQIILGCFMTLNVLNHIMVLLVTGYVMYLFIGSTAFMDLHILLCTVGYVLLMAEGIVVLAGENVWSRCITRRTKSHVHWILQAVGAIFSISGTVLVIITREDLDLEHFSSTHSITGIISVGLLIVSAILGLPALFAGRLRKLIKPVINKCFHNLLGTLCFIIGMVAQCTGYYTRWMSRNTTTEIQSALYWLTIIITILCLTGAAKSGGQQIWGIIRLFRRR